MFCGFSLIVIDLAVILKFKAVILIFLDFVGTWGKCAAFVFHLSLNFYFAGASC